MRKLLFTVLLSLGSIAGKAQTTVPKGTWQLDGSISYYKTYSENVGGGYSSSQTTSSFGVNPGVGYLVADNLALGLSGGYSSMGYRGVSDNGNSTYVRDSRGGSVGPFADYYHFFTSYFGLKGRASAAYGRGSEYYTQNNAARSTTTYQNVGGSLVPSLVFFPVARLALGASFGGLYYNRGWSKNPDVLNGDGQGYTLGANFGLNYLALSGTFYPGRK